MQKDTFLPYSNEKWRFFSLLQSSQSAMLPLSFLKILNPPQQILINILVQLTKQRIKCIAANQL